MKNIQISSAILANPTYSSGTKLVYAFITCTCKEQPQLTFEFIAENVGITRMSTMRCVDTLVEAGLIKRELQGRKSVYTLVEGLL
jgi:predicted ArsR family transcriptional regulator